LPILIFVYTVNRAYLISHFVLYEILTAHFVHDFNVHFMLDDFS